MERQPWTAYQDLIRLVMAEGEEIVTTHPKDEADPNSDLEKARRIIGRAQFTVNLDGGVFPLDALRSGRSIFKNSLAEIFAFARGARYRDELHEAGVTWWDRWLTKEFCASRGLAEGDLGPASYGPMWRAKPVGGGRTVDVFRGIVEKLKCGKIDRYMWLQAYDTAHVTTFGAAVPPCHGNVYFYVEGGDHLSCVHDQRSGDLLVGVFANIAQYAGLLMAVAAVTGLKPGNIAYRYMDLHIYERQYEHAEVLLSREPLPLPDVRLVNTGDLEWPWEFSEKNFELLNYRAHKFFPIPTPI